MGNNVSTTNLNREREITRRQFQAALNQATSDVEMQQKAMSIFNTYAKKTAGGDDNVLDVDEQRMAQEAFSALDADGKDEVSENEFNAKKNENPDLKDTSYQVYSAFTQALGSVAKKEKSSVELAKEKFSAGGEDGVKKAVASYLLGVDVSSLGGEVSDSMVFYSKDDYEVIMPQEGSNDPIKVKYREKEFIVHIVDDKVSIDCADSENPVTLQQAMLDADTTDVRHNYLNRHGADGNNLSTYDAEKGEITNSSNRRQHVNPAQTFISMVVNNNTESTLSFTHGLEAEDVIGVITGDKDADGITLPQLLKYIRAVYNETVDTDKAGIRNGSRTAAYDLDFDAKDMANLGVVFKKYAGSDGKLDKNELQSLIDDLTKNKKTMTELARGDNNKYQYHAPTNPQDKPLPEADEPVGPNPTPQPQGKVKANANRQRYIAGSGKKETVNYEYKDGMRTVVDKDGYRVTDYNIAEYEDHGLLGSGKKDFVKIQGLPPAVRAEVFDGELQHNMIIKVKDSRGNEKYYRVNYDATKGTYTMGDEITEATAQGKKPPKAEKSKGQEQTPQGTPAPKPGTTVSFRHMTKTIQSTVIKGQNNEPVAHETKVADLFESSASYNGSYHLYRDFRRQETFAGNHNVSFSEIKSKDGKTILKYDAENDKFYDAKGKEIVEDQAKIILADLYSSGKYKDATLVQNIDSGSQIPQGNGGQKEYDNLIDNPDIVQFGHKICGSGAFIRSNIGRDGNGAAISLASRLSDAATGLFDSTILSNYMSSPNSGIVGVEISSSEIKDKDGKIIIRCEKGKYYDGSGNQLDRSQAKEILNDIATNIRKKYKDVTFVQHIKQKNQPSTPAPQNDGVDYSTLDVDGWRTLARKATTPEAQNDLVDKYMQYRNVPPEDREDIMQLLEFTTPGDPTEGMVSFDQLVTDYPGTTIETITSGGGDGTVEVIVTAPNGNKTTIEGFYQEHYNQAEEFIKANRKK